MAYPAGFTVGGEHSSYFVEYKIPFTMLKDGEGNDYNGSEYIGFDVTIVDLDEEGTSNGAATETER